MNLSKCSYPGPSCVWFQKDLGLSRLSRTSVCSPLPGHSFLVPEPKPLWMCHLPLLLLPLGPSGTGPLPGSESARLLEKALCG